MSNYTKITDFEAKDSLPSGDSGKIIRGTEFEVEFDNISTAIATKADQAGPTFTGTASFAAVSITNDLTVDTNTLHVDSTNNRVGIGTTTPLVTFQANLAANSNLGFNDAGVIPTVLAFNDGGARIPMGLEAQSFKFTASSTDALNINTVGNVGIGTASPTALLTTLGGTSTANSVAQSLDLQHGGSGAAGYECEIRMGRPTTANRRAVIRAVGTGSNFTAPELAFDTNEVERMRIDSDGDVQIGSAGSVQPLLRRSTATGGLEIDSTAASGGPLIVKDNGAERLRIDTSGNVGIGTTNPADRLAVLGTISVQDTSTATDALKISASTVSSYQNTITHGDIGLEFDNNSASRGYVWSVNGSQKVLIDSSGNVGIGTDSPSYKLDLQDASSAIVNVQRTGATASALLMAAASGETQILSRQAPGVFGAVPLTFEVGGSERMRIDSSGNLLVGTTTTSINSGIGIKAVYDAVNPAVNVVGSASTNTEVGYRLYSTGAAAFRFYVSYGGQIYATSSSITALSDVSLKENIRDLDKGLDSILALKPRRFDWKNGDDSDVMGFIAQEVEEVMPELVSDYQYSEDETKKAVRMGDMVPSLVKAIQEQQVMIEALKAEVEALKNA